MGKANPIFEYGITQEDALVDAAALDLSDGDRLLCIGSAGDTPLNFLALKDIWINSVDVLESQNCLIRLKLAAVRAIDPPEAAALIGLMKATPETRRKYFEKVSELLPPADQEFWNAHPDAVASGPINRARFEQYISRLNGIGLVLIGRKQVMRLFELDTVADQEDYFDLHISTALLRGIFRLAFHPRIYKKRGINPQGLTHSGERNTAEFFYSKLRNFCCSTPARRNYFLQFSFFDRVLFTEALPEYLRDEGVARIRENHWKIKVEQSDIRSRLEAAQPGEYDKIHLSNIGDWMTKPEFADLLRLALSRSVSGNRIFFRYIHFNHPIPDDLQGLLIPDYQFGRELSLRDRYPFYGLVPLILNQP